MQSDGVAYRYRLEAIHVKAGIDGLCVRQRIVVLSVMERDVSGSSFDLIDPEAPVLRAALRERRELHVNETT